MTTLSAQQAVAEYHRELSQHSHHGGHDMYIFHGNWHQRNGDPTPPSAPDRNWAVDLVFGTNFLQMHHEMLKAADNEPKLHMLHQSLVSWYASKGYDLPDEWEPLTQIPNNLAYTPNLDVYPEEIRDAVRNWSSTERMSPEQWLQRKTDDPNFALPRYFTRSGVRPEEAGEPYTGARKLADFRNVNQLGCCIVFPHNRWHMAIEGAMRSVWTAIADPIFYFGVHWHVERVFDEYKLIEAERKIRALDRPMLRASDALESEDIALPERFSPQQLERREEDIALSRSFKQDLIQN